MFKHLLFICASIYIGIALMACQPEPETLTPQPAPEGSTPPVSHTNQVKVVETQQTVNLNVSEDFLNKVEASDRQTAELRQPGAVTISNKEKRKIELGGGVTVDKEEKDLTQKIDGGEVTLTIPFD